VQVRLRLTGYRKTAATAGRDWWTRTRSIRTAGTLPFEAALVETSQPPAYQAIASKALQLRELGLADRVIAARLGVTDKTIAKAIRWLRETALR
jgi:hypothetical protein